MSSEPIDHVPDLSTNSNNSSNNNERKKEKKGRRNKKNKNKNKNKNGKQNNKVEMSKLFDEIADLREKLQGSTDEVEERYDPELYIPRWGADYREAIYSGVLYSGLGVFLYRHMRWGPLWTLLPVTVPALMLWVRARSNSIRKAAAGVYLQYPVLLAVRARTVGNRLRTTDNLETLRYTLDQTVDQLRGKDGRLMSPDGLGSDVIHDLVAIKEIVYLDGATPTLREWANILYLRLVGMFNRS